MKILVSLNSKIPELPVKGTPTSLLKFIEHNFGLMPHGPTHGKITNTNKKFLANALTTQMWETELVDSNVILYTSPVSNLTIKLFDDGLLETGEK